MAAADESDPVDQVTSFLEGLAAQAPAEEGAPSAQADPGLPAFEVPPEIRNAFQQLADAAGLPENCVDGVADAIELIVNGLIALPLELAGLLADLLALLGEGDSPLPPELQELLDQLLAGLEGEESPELEPEPDAVVAPDAPEASDAQAGALDLSFGGSPDEKTPEVPAPGDEEAPELPTLIEGLLALGAALEGCIPEAPAEEPEPEPDNQPVVATPEQPAPPAQPVAQPVAYLGYAPTGADTARADDVSVPLTALGGGLVLVAAGAAGYGMRGRAVRTRD